MLSTKRIDATEGPLLPQMISYGVPVLLSTLIQNLFNSLDIAVLGNFADTSAVASMGATASVNKVLIYLFIGIATGTGVVLARAIGARDQEKMQRTVDTAMLFAFFGGLVLAVASWFLAPLFMDLTDCPADCYDGALLYLRIYICGAPAIMLYNFASSIITSAGDTQRPLYYMLAGGALNVTLNIVLCLLIPKKVAAVAIATVSPFSRSHLSRSSAPGL